jgi:hypothetical protein
MVDLGPGVKPKEQPAPTPHSSKEPEVRIYAHSPIIYWWVIWAYGFVCAILTYAQGDKVAIGGAKAVLIHPSPWLGISFAALLLFVIVSTSVRARGMGAFMLILLVAAAAGGTYAAVNSKQLFEAPPTLLIYLNLAFYIIVSSVLLCVWLVIVFITDRMSYWRFRGSHIERVRRLAGAMGRVPESYSVLHARITSHRDDLLNQRILGLGLIGLGTSDVDVKVSIPGGGNEHLRMENVWRATRNLRKVQEVMGAKAAVVY